MSHNDLTIEGQPRPSSVRSSGKEASFDLENYWKTLSGLESTAYSDGLKIIKWARRLEPKLEFDTRASGLLFESPLQVQHICDELRARLKVTPCMMTFSDTDTDHERSLSRLIQAISADADTHVVLRTPSIVMVTSDSKCYRIADGIAQAGQRQAMAEMFSGLSTLSPYAVFAEDWSLLVSSSGALQPVSIDKSLTSAVMVLTHGSHLVVTFERSDSNAKVMDRKDTFKTTTALLRALSGPQFLHQQPGQAVYIASGQPYFVLTLEAGAYFVYDCANPSKNGWELTIRAREDTLEEFFDPDEEILDPVAERKPLYEALQRIKAEIDLWRRSVSLLPRERRPRLDAISRSEGESFLARLTVVRDQVKETYQQCLALAAPDADGAGEKRPASDVVESEPPPRKRPATGSSSTIKQESL